MITLHITQPRADRAPTLEVVHGGPRYQGDSDCAMVARAAVEGATAICAQGEPVHLLQRRGASGQGQHQPTVSGALVYISGPMTDLPRLNYPAFFAAAEQLRSKGWPTVNPADSALPLDLPWATYLRADIVILAGCTHVALLPGWERSKGAKLEVRIAKALGMACMPVHEFKTLTLQKAA